MADGKRYGGMTGVPKLEQHYGKDVYVNPVTESLRRRECLCYNCTQLGAEKSESEQCPIAAALYAACQKFDVALIITRCPAWKPNGDGKPSELYQISGA